MTRARHLTAVPSEGSAEVAVSEAIAGYLRWLASKRGRSGRITSPRTVRSYTAALPVAFAGIGSVAELATETGAERLRMNLRTAWGEAAPATFNARRAAVASALDYFRREEWLPAGIDPLGGLGREHEPRTEGRVRDRGAIERLITSRTRPLQDRALFSLLYSSAARCEEVLRLDVSDLDRANRRARTIRKGSKADELMYDTRTARLLGQLLGKRSAGPLFLSDRTPRDGTVNTADIDPVSGLRRLTYRTAARRLEQATGGWAPHDLRHSRLTHAGEDGATEADLMNLSGHEDRRTLQRYLAPSKEGTHRRLDQLDVHRGTWTLDAGDIAARLAAHEADQPAAPALQQHEPGDTPTGAEPAEPVADGPRAAGPSERIDLDTVTTERNPVTGTSRVLATSQSGEHVLVGFLDRQGKQWHVQTPHLTRISGHWHTKNDALLRLVEPHAGG